MKPFSKKALEEIFKACKGHTIMHTDPGGGIVFRHDVDNDFLKSYRCSLIQDIYGIKAAYYILNTAPYWGKHFEEMRDMQERGHEIGWHNDALSEWVTDRSQDLEAIIRAPIDKMRSEELNITGTVAHGNSLCYKYGYINYQIWENAPKNKKMPGIGNKRFSLDDFGLSYDSLLTIKRDYYAFDSRKKWFSEDILELINKAIREQKRLVILIHPQHWHI